MSVVRECQVQDDWMDIIEVLITEAQQEDATRSPTVTIDSVIPTQTSTQSNPTTTTKTTTTTTTTTTMANVPPRRKYRRRASATDVHVNVNVNVDLNSLSTEKIKEFRTVRKRAREKQLRNHVNAHIDDLTPLLLRTETEYYSSSSSSSSSESLSASFRRRGGGGVPAPRPPSNRIELFSRTIDMLKELTEANKRSRMELGSIQQQLKDLNEREQAFDEEEENKHPQQQQQQQQRQQPINLPNAMAIPPKQPIHASLNSNSDSNSNSNCNSHINGHNNDNSNNLINDTLQQPLPLPQALPIPMPTQMMQTQMLQSLSTNVTTETSSAVTQGQQLMMVPIVMPTSEKGQSPQMIQMPLQMMQSFPFMFMPQQQQQQQHPLPPSPPQPQPQPQPQMETTATKKLSSMVDGNQSMHQLKEMDAASSTLAHCA